MHTGKFEISLHQPDTTGFAQTRQLGKNGINCTPVTWILDVRQSPQSANGGLQKELLFCVELRYDFRFAGHKAAAEVGQAGEAFAQQSPTARLQPMSNHTAWREHWASLQRARNRDTVQMS